MLSSRKAQEQQKRTIHFNSDFDSIKRCREKKIFSDQSQGSQNNQQNRNFKMNRIDGSTSTSNTGKGQPDNYVWEKQKWRTTATNFNVFFLHILLIITRITWINFPLHWKGEGHFRNIIDTYVYQTRIYDKRTILPSCI